MRNRAWRICTRTAVMVAASVMALTAGVASSASAAGSSSTTTINITQGRFNPILPGVRVVSRAVAADDDVTVFHGFSSFKSIKIQSQGFDLTGRLHGKLRSYDFKKLYQVYNLPSSESWGVWVFKYKEDKSQSVLKPTFEQEQLADLDVDMNFKVSADALKNVSTLRIGFETMRLQYNGRTKDFTIVNGASGGAKDQNGNDVPVDFQPV